MPLRFAHCVCSLAQAVADSACLSLLLVHQCCRDSSLVLQSLSMGTPLQCYDWLTASALPCPVLLKQCSLLESRNLPSCSMAERGSGSGRGRSRTPVGRPKAKGSVAKAKAVRGGYAEESDDSIRFTSSEEDGPTAGTTMATHSGLPPAGPPPPTPALGTMGTGPMAATTALAMPAFASSPHASCCICSCHRGGDRGDPNRHYNHDDPCYDHIFVLKAPCIDLPASLPGV